MVGIELDQINANVAGPAEGGSSWATSDVWAVGKKEPSAAAATVLAYMPLAGGVGQEGAGQSEHGEEQLLSVRGPWLA